jgi:hypothetical protein
METRKVGRVKEELRSEIIVDLLVRECFGGRHESTENSRKREKGELKLRRKI